ncbi:MAG: DNA integrity scanning diadenylate cyclase DisA [Acidimicrobiales bacterium]
MLHALAAVAPGTPLREGLDRILQSGKGALIVIGDGPEVLQICSGGFLLDAEFSPQRLAELAKMDGAIVLAPDARRIARANVHLVPDPSVPTSETGTRHRTAERVARFVDVPVLSVSEDMNVITLYRDTQKHTFETIARLFSKANQALSTLERYRSRLDNVAATLNVLELEDLVTARDVVQVLQRLEMVRRIAEEIHGYVVELGADGRLVLLQLGELIGGVQDDRRAVLLDYVDTSAGWSPEKALVALASLPPDGLLDPKLLAGAVRLPRAAQDLDNPLQPAGHRLLGRIPRLSDTLVVRIVTRFGSLPKLMQASAADLCAVEGIGEARAAAIRDGLDRIAETVSLDRS